MDLEEMVYPLKMDNFSQPKIRIMILGRKIVQQGLQVPGGTKIAILQTWMVWILVQVPKHPMQRPLFGALSQPMIFLWRQ